MTDRNLLNSRPDFLDPPEEFRIGADASYAVVLPIPFEKTTSYLKGTVFGPHRLLEASGQLEVFDPELNRIPARKGIFTDWALVNDGVMDAETQVALKMMSQRSEHWLKKGKFVLGLGGEHTVTVGIAPPVLKAHKDNITIVHIDAHADLKDSYENDPFSHACAIRRVCDLAPVVSIGIRSVDEEEYEFAHGLSNIHTFYDHELDRRGNWMESVFKSIQTSKVYLTIDLDGLSPSIMPSVGTPQPGGLEWKDVTTFLRMLTKRYEVVAADINELMPIDDLPMGDFIAAKLAHKVLGYVLTGRNG